MPDASPPPAPGGWDDLTSRLRVLRAAAGSPSYADLVRRVDAVRAARGVPPHERRPGRVTVYDAFRDGRTRLDVELLADLVRALGGTDADATAWRGAHAAVAASQTRSSAGDPVVPGPRATLRSPDARLPRLRGRDAETADLLARLPGRDGPDGSHVTVLTGLPGAGITALAHAVAAAHGARTGAVVLLAPDDAVPEDVLAALPAATTPRPLLVLPDATADAARAVADGAPGWSLLVTARRSLPLGDAPHVALGPLDPEPAVAMLGDLVGPERVAAEPEAARALAAACGYLPVSLAVAAGQVTERPDWSLADHHHRVEQSAHALPALDAAYRDLDPEQALVLRRLALLDAPLPTDWLAVLAGVDAPSVRRALAVLEDAHLVRPDGADRAGVHDLVRRYAREAAQQDEPVSARRSAVERLAARLVEVARPLVAAVAPHHDVTAGVAATTTPAVARERLDALRPVAVAAGLRCADLGLAAPLGDLSGLLSAYLDTAGHRRDALLLHGAAAESADPAGRSRAGRDLGRVLEHLGRYDEALSHLVRAHESGHDPRPGQTLNRIGNVYKRLGRTDDAVRTYAEAATAAWAGGDAVSEGRAVGNHADALRVLGRHEESFAGYDLALALAEQVGDVLNVAVVTSNSALALEHAGRYPEARARVALARVAAERLGDANLGLRTALQEQRLAVVVGDEVAAAVPALRALVDRAADLGDVEVRAEVLAVLGQAQHRTGDLEAAAATLADALEAATGLRARLVEVEALNARGAVALDAGEPAETWFARALDLAREAGDVGEQVVALTGLGDCARSAGDAVGAAARWREALDAGRAARPGALAALRTRIAALPAAPPSG